MISITKIDVIDGAVMGNAVVGPLGECANMLGNPAGIEQAQLL